MFNKGSEKKYFSKLEEICCINLQYIFLRPSFNKKTVYINFSSWFNKSFEISILFDIHTCNVDTLRDWTKARHFDSRMLSTCLHAHTVWPIACVFQRLERCVPVVRLKITTVYPWPKYLSREKYWKVERFVYIYFWKLQ